MASGNEFGSNVKASTGVGVHQNLVVEGDIVVESGTYLIENTVLNVTGKITASNDATILIRNATLYVTTGEYPSFRDGIVLADRSRLIVENATIFLESAYIRELSYITVSDEAIANITDSQLSGNVRIVGRQDSRIYINRSVLKGPNPADYQICGVMVEDNSTARIQDSELDSASARGDSSVLVSDSIIQASGVDATDNGLVEIENSLVGTIQWFFDNSTLLIQNSTVAKIQFGGLSLTVKDSGIAHDLSSGGNSTVWLTSVSASHVTARDHSTIWLINSYAGAITTREEGKVYVGWQLPLLGIVAFPHNWVPILQGIALVAVLVLIIILLVVLNRRWKRWQEQKLKEQALLSSRS